MNHDVVVRIVHSDDQAHLPHMEEYFPTPEKEVEKWQLLVRRLTLAAIVASGIFFGLSFFNIGLEFRDIAVIIGLPLAIGLSVSYVLR